MRGSELDAVNEVNTLLISGSEPANINNVLNGILLRCSSVSVLLSSTHLMSSQVSNFDFYFC